MRTSCFDNVLVSRDGVLRRGDGSVCQRPRLEGPADIAGLRRRARIPASHPDHRHTRMLLSNTVRVHRALRAAGVEAQLEVYEGQSHAQYLFDDRLPETAVAFGEIAEFFDKHLGK